MVGVVIKHIIMLIAVLTLLIAVCDASVICYMCKDVLEKGISVVTNSGRTLIVCQPCFLNGTYVKVV